MWERGDACFAPSLFPHSAAELSPICLRPLLFLRCTSSHSAFKEGCVSWPELRGTRAVVRCFESFHGLAGGSSGSEGHRLFTTLLFGLRPCLFSSPCFAAQCAADPEFFPMRSCTSSCFPQLQPPLSILRIPTQIPWELSDKQYSAATSALHGPGLMTIELLQWLSAHAVAYARHSASRQWPSLKL